MGTNKINVLSIKFVPPKNCRKYIEFVAIYIYRVSNYRLASKDALVRNGYTLDALISVPPHSY